MKQKKKMQMVTFDPMMCATDYQGYTTMDLLGRQSGCSSSCLTKLFPWNQECSWLQYFLVCECEVSHLTKCYHFSICIHMQMPTVNLQIPYSSCEFFTWNTKNVILLTKSFPTSASLIPLSSYHLNIYYLIFWYFKGSSTPLLTSFFQNNSSSLGAAVTGNSFFLTIM